MIRQKLCLPSHLRKALAAVDRTVRLGLKGNLRLAAAGCAGRGKELTGTARRVLAGVTAGLAALRLVLEATLCIELLLTSGENEFRAALFALQSLVFEHFESSLLKKLAFRLILRSAHAEVAEIWEPRQLAANTLYSVVNGLFRLVGLRSHFRIRQSG